MADEMKRTIGPDGREWVHMPAVEYWRRIEEAARGPIVDDRPLEPAGIDLTDAEFAEFLAAAKGYESPSNQAINDHWDQAYELGFDAGIAAYKTTTDAKYDQLCIEYRRLLIQLVRSYTGFWIALTRKLRG